MSTNNVKYERQDKVYLENVYTELLKRLAKAKEARDKQKKASTDVNKCKTNIQGFFNKGLSGKADVKANYTEEQKLFAAKEAKIFNKFAKKNYKYAERVLNDERTPEQEIQRIRNGKNARFIVKVLTVGALVTAVACGVVKCCNKKSNTTGTTTTTSVTDDNTNNTENTTTNTTPSDTTNKLTFDTSDTDQSKALESILDGQKGYVVVDPTTGETTIYYYDDNDNNYGNTNNGSGYTNGNGGGNSSTTTTTTTAEVTEGTTETTKTPEATTTTTGTQPTINTNGETVATTSIEETEPAYSESPDGKDVVINNYDGVNPSYIEEDPTQTYETFFYIPEEDIVYDEQVDAYTLTLRK